MQAVISRVHQIVVNNTQSEADRVDTHDHNRHSTTAASQPTKSALPGGSNGAQTIAAFSSTGATHSSASSSSSSSLSALYGNTSSHSTAAGSSASTSSLVASPSPSSSTSTASGSEPVASAALPPPPTTTTTTSTTRQATPEIKAAVEKLQYATLLSERKKAIASMQELANSFTKTIKSEVASDEETKVAMDQLERLGQLSIPQVLNAIITDPRDTELMEAMLEYLQQLVGSCERNAEYVFEPFTPPTPLISMAFVTSTSTSANANNSKGSGLQLVFELLQDPSPWIRGPTVTLIKLLQDAQPKKFSSLVLTIKESLRRLLEMVEEKREHIRDAALQILVKLTEKERTVQQFLAFEEGFSRLFGIVESEGLVLEPPERLGEENGRADDGDDDDSLSNMNNSVVSDCLQIVCNMVRDNPLTQKLFQETNFLESHVSRLLAFSNADTVLVDAMDGVAEDKIMVQKQTQKKRSLKLTLQLVRLFLCDLYENVAEEKLDEIARREQQQQRQQLPSIQRFVGRQARLMKAIGELVCCCEETFCDLQLQAMDLLQMIVKDHDENQNLMVSLTTTQSRKNVLAVLFERELLEDEASPVGTAASNCLDTIFDKNETMAMSLFQFFHSTPSMDPMEDLELHQSDRQQGRAKTPGKVLLTTLIGNAEKILLDGDDSDQLEVATRLVWKASDRFRRLLNSSDFCKELALRIPAQLDEPESANGAISGNLFLTRCIKLFSMDKLQASADNRSQRLKWVFAVKVAVFRLLMDWCVDCPRAVNEIVGCVNHLSLFVANMQSHDQESEGNQFSAQEQTQLRGLCACLFGICLEFMTQSDKITQSQLLELINKKIGLETFTDAMVQFQQSNLFVRSCQTSQTSLASSRSTKTSFRVVNDAAAKASGLGIDFLYEKSFTTWYIDWSKRIQARIITIYTGDDSSSGGQGEDAHSASPVAAYQDLIRVQDKQIHELQQQIEELRLMQHAQPQASSSPEIDSNHLATQAKDLELAAQKLKELEENHAKEKQGLQARIDELLKSVRVQETRIQGLTLELNQANRSSASVYSNGSGSNSSNNDDSSIWRRRLEAQVETLQKEISEREVRMAEMDQTFQSQLAKQRISVETVEMTWLQEKQELVNQVETQQEQIEKLSQNLELFEANQQLLEKEKAHLHKELESFKQKPTSPVSKLEGDGNAPSDDTEKASMIQRLEEQLKHADSQIGLLLHEKRGSDKFKTRVHELEERLKQLETLNGTLQQEKDQLEAEQVELKYQLQVEGGAEKNAPSIEKESDDSTATLEVELHEQLQQLEATNVQWQHQNQQLEAEVLSLKQQLQEQQDQADLAQAINDEKNKDEAQALQQVEETNRVLQQKLDTQHQTYLRLQNQLEDMQKELEETRAQNKVQKEAFEQTEAQISEDSSQQLVDVKAKLEEATAMYSKLEESHRKLEESFAQEKSQKEHFQEQMALVGAQLAKEHTAKKDMEKVIQDQLQEIGALTRNMDQLHALAKREAASKQEAEDLLAQLTSKESLIIELRTKVAKLTEQLEVMTQQEVQKDQVTKRLKLTLEQSEIEATTNGTSNRNHAAIQVKQRVSMDSPADTTDQEAIVNQRDLFILLASLEIQCEAFGEVLNKAQGPQSVESARSLSKQRGAVQLVPFVSEASSLPNGSAGAESSAKAAGGAEAGVEVCKQKF